MSEYDDLTKELKHIKALLAMNSIKDRETKTEKILFLNQFGFDANEIAILVGTTAGTVSVAISQAKSKKLAKKNNKAKQASGGEGND
jgi:DNA-directed RNA polymerase specialized sigma24 family protein